MSVNLKNCNKKSTFKLSNGDIVTFQKYATAHDDKYDEVKVAYFSDELYRTMDGRCPFISPEKDIIERYIIHRKCSNIAKYFINEFSGSYVVRVIIDNWFFDLPEYSSMKAAKIGVKRFCKRIGFKCVLGDTN